MPRGDVLLVVFLSPPHAEAPWVEVDASPQRFGRGQELQLNCTAGGYPQPRITWKRWGWVLEQDQR